MTPDGRVDLHTVLRAPGHGACAYKHGRLSRGYVSTDDHGLLRA